MVLQEIGAEKELGIPPQAPPALCPISGDDEGGAGEPGGVFAQFFYGFQDKPYSTSITLRGSSPIMCCSSSVVMMCISNAVPVLSGEEATKLGSAICVYAPFSSPDSSRQGILAEHFFEKTYLKLTSAFEMRYDAPA